MEALHIFSPMNRSFYVRIGGEFYGGFRKDKRA